MTVAISYPGVMLTWLQNNQHHDQQILSEYKNIDI